MIKSNVIGEETLCITYLINQYNKCSEVPTSPAGFLMMMKYHLMGNCYATRIRIQENKEAYKEASDQRYRCLSVFSAPVLTMVTRFICAKMPKSKVKIGFGDFQKKPYLVTL